MTTIDLLKFFVIFFDQSCHHVDIIGNIVLCKVARQKDYIQSSLTYRLVGKQPPVSA